MSALDQAVEEARSKLLRLYATRPEAPNHSCGPWADCDMICASWGWHQKDERAAEQAYEAAIVARATHQLTAENAKLREALTDLVADTGCYCDPTDGGRPCSTCRGDVALESTA